MINLGLDDNKDPVKGPDVIAEAMLKLKADIGDAEQTQAPDDTQQFDSLPQSSRTLVVATESLDDSQDQDEQTMELRQKTIAANQKKNIVNSSASGVFGSRLDFHKPALTFSQRVEALRQEMLASQTVVEIDSLACATDQSEVGSPALESQSVDASTKKISAAHIGGVFDKRNSGLYANDPVLYLSKVVGEERPGAFSNDPMSYSEYKTFLERFGENGKAVLLKQQASGSDAFHADVVEMDSLGWSRPNQPKETQDKVQVILTCILMTNIVRTRGGSKSLSSTSMGLWYWQTVKTPKDLVGLLSYTMSSKTDWNLDFRKLLAKNSSVVKSLRSLVNLNGDDNDDISDEQFLFAISDKEMVFILAAWLGMQFEETKTLYQERNPGEDEGPVYRSKCDEAMSESQFQRVHRSAQWHASNDFAALYNNVRDIVQSTIVKLKVNFEKPAEKRASLRREKKKKVLKDYKESVAYKLINSFKAK